MTPGRLPVPVGAQVPGWPEPTRQPPSTEPVAPVCLIHIHKTAGSSLRSELLAQYGDFLWQIVDGINNARAFMSRPAEERALFGLVFGHAPFYDPFEGTGFATQFISMVRRPLDRVVSFYRHIKRVPEHPLRPAGLPDEPTIIDIIDNRFVPFDNEQVRFLAGPEAWEKPFGRINERDLARAIENIESRGVVMGVQEHFARSLLRFADALRWDRTRMRGVRVNAAPPEQDYPDLDDASQAMLKDLNCFDADLYNWVLEHFPEV